MEKYFVVSGDGDVWTEECKSFDSAEVKLMDIHKRLNKSQSKNLKDGNYWLYIQKTVAEKVEGFEDMLETSDYNSFGYKIIETIDWKEILKEYEDLEDEEE